MTLKATNRLATWAIAGAFAFTAAAGFSQSPATALSDGFVGSTGTTPASVRGGLGATPGVGASRIDNYINQDEQLNLDANAGNVRVLRTNEKAALNDFVTASFPIKNVAPRELRNVFRSILQLEGGTAEVIRDKKTGENFLQVIAPSFTLPYIARAVPTLDESWLHEYDTGSADVYYKAVNRKAGDVDVFASQFASSDNGASAVDTTANAVSRIDEPYRIESYLKGAKMVDIPANQVLLDVTIYEITSNDDLKLGLDYIAWKNGPGRTLWDFVYTAVDSRSNNQGNGSIFNVQSWASSGVWKTNYDQIYKSINYVLPSSFIDWLQVKGDARVINQQQLQVKSANTATLSTDDQLLALVSNENLDNVGPWTEPTLEYVYINNNPYSDEATRNGSEEDSFPYRDHVRSLNYSNAGSTGISLAVTPYVGLESMELAVSMEIGDLNGVAPNGTPIIGTRTLDTTVRLMDGQEYVVAHLKRTNNIEEANKAPFLGSIPVLGYLFGNENQANRKSDVLVVITPHFHLSSQTDLGLTADAQSTKDIVTGNAAPQLVARVPFGYDQWMLDPAAGTPL